MTASTNLIKRMRKALEEAPQRPMAAQLLAAAARTKLKNGSLPPATALQLFELAFGPQPLDDEPRQPHCPTCQCY